MIDFNQFLSLKIKKKQKLMFQTLINLLLSFIHKNRVIFVFVVRSRKKNRYPFFKKKKWILIFPFNSLTCAHWIRRIQNKKRIFDNDNKHTMYIQQQQQQKELIHINHIKWYNRFGGKWWCCWWWWWRDVI